MARKKRKPEEILNPEHYFNRLIAQEIKRDRIKTAQYYKFFTSLDELLDGGNEGLSAKIQLQLTVNDSGRDFDDALSALSKFGWIEQIENVRIYHAVTALTDQQKTLLTLRFASGLSQAETAEVMGISQQAVSSYERRILKKIRKQLNNDKTP